MQKERQSDILICKTAKVVILFSVSEALFRHCDCSSDTVNTQHHDAQPRELYARTAN